VASWELYPGVGFIVTNMSCPAERVVAFYNKRGTCDEWIKEGEGAIMDVIVMRNVLRQRGATPASCGRLQPRLFPAHAGDAGAVRALIKIGAKVVSHGRYVAFQMAEVAIPGQKVQEILRLIGELRPQPPPAPA
jgi:hypothetical protein